MTGDAVCLGIDGVTCVGRGSDGGVDKTVIYSQEEFSVFHVTEPVVEENTWSGVSSYSKVEGVEESI